MDELIEYTNYSKLKYNIKIKYFLYIILSILIVLCVMIHNISIPMFYYNKSILIKQNNKYYLKLLVLEKDINKFTNNKVLIIGDKNSKYEIKSISNIIVDENFNSYYEIYLDLNKNKGIENTVYEVKMKYDEKLLNEIIYEFIIGR